MLQHWFFVLLAFWRLVTSFLRAHWHLRFKIKIEGKELMSRKEISRMQHYFLGTTFLSTVFSCLIGRRRSSNELYLYANLSALASFFDDMVDAQRKQLSLHIMVPEDPISFGQMVDKRGLAQRLLDRVLQKLPSRNKSSFQENMQRVYAAEIGGQYSGKNLNINEIITNTMEKGSYAVLLFRAVLEPLPGRAERLALLEFGGLVQLSDDIFDIWFDQAAGTETAAVLYVGNGNLAALVQLFEAQVVRTRQAFKKMPISGWRCHNALALVHVLTSITRVCLRRYQQLAATHIEIPFSDRKKMVVDMAGFTNQLLAARLLFFKHF